MDKPSGFYEDKAHAALSAADAVKEGNLPAIKELARAQVMATLAVLAELRAGRG